MYYRGLTAMAALTLVWAVADCSPAADDGEGLPDGSGRTGDGGPICQPPDMLVVLDRTMSMHRTPDGERPPNTPEGHKQSKWYLAITAIEAVSAEFDRGIRFGLELFPRDPGGGACVTLSQKIDNASVTNPECETGEVPVTPGLETSDAINAALDPETTLLCRSTPIGAGLDMALATLQNVQDPIRSQYALLVTDGADTCGQPDPAERACALALAGIKTYVIGFDGSSRGINPSVLNNMACAGHTAPDPEQNCRLEGNCYVASDPRGSELFLKASNGAELSARLGEVASETGCVVE